MSFKIVHAVISLKMNPTYATFVSSQLDNTKMNKFIGKYTSTMGGKGEDFQQFFRNLSFLQKHNYSFVVETDFNVLKFMLNESTRKFMCDTFNNIRIIRVVNIRDESVPFSFGSAPVKRKDSYLICSKSAGFFGMPQNVVEFSTYDMISNSYTQLNQIDFTSMSEHNYSFDFSDYHFDKPVKQKMTESVQNTEKRRRVIKQE